MESHIARWKQSGITLALGDRLEVGLMDWFVSHVSTMDFVTAHYIKNTQGKEQA